MISFVARIMFIVCGLLLDTNCVRSEDNICLSVLFFLITIVFETGIEGYVLKKNNNCV